MTTEKHKAGDAIRVLIVDDEDRFRATTAAILARRGFDVKAVGSGIEAIEQIKQAAFDVVVLDVQMPGMDGNEALREIKNVAPDIAVLMLTGHGTPESVLESLRDGITDYLTKPCPMDLLARRIREACVLKGGVSEKEPRVKHIMSPLSSFDTIHEDRTVDDAIDVILRGFTQTLTTSTLRETLHRSILVQDKNDEVIGIITFTDLLRGLQPPYMRLLTEKPPMADALGLESLNYSGMFTIMARDLGSKTVREIMPDTPPVIDADANLMEVATRFLDLNLRRLLVTQGGKIVGVIREQDLFFEMANIITQHGQPDDGR
ncbi:MAG TPA: response regulator [Thermoguttaceae bacterium]|nr:response regulator [Thermoguttaceae bacterium]